MGRKSRFSIAKKDIVTFFENSHQKIYDYITLDLILEKYRKKWGLTKTMSTSKFIEELITNTPLKEVILGNYYRFMYHPATVYEISATLKPKGYFSHFSALYLQQLTKVHPTTLYLNYEQSKKDGRNNYKIEQGNIDQAFSKPQRTSHNVIIYEDKTIILLNGKYTNNEGIITVLHPTEGEVKVTSIERTLIDITVRPAYSGGVTEVLNAYEKAKDYVSVKKITEILEHLRFTYPYHQAIGFYMEKAGYNENDFNIFKELNFEFNFYLTHAMKEKEFSKKWKIYYPKGF
ncbi:MAG: hypothetical protein WCK32_02495 [Chlorobiaceae bacterium]